MTAQRGPLAPHRDGVVIAVRVQPRASTNEIVGVRDGALQLRVTAPPVDGAANDAIVQLLARTLGVRKSDVQVVGGASARLKRVLVRDVTASAVARRLGID